MWSKEQIDVLRRLWSRGEPARIIALQLRTTRNAVIGKAHRLKLESRTISKRTDANISNKKKSDLPEVKM